MPSIARAPGVRETGRGRLRERLNAFLDTRRLLLVLDNFEQVLQAGAELATMLEACPGLTMLVTSRAVLHVTGERDIEASPLASPDPNRLPSLAETSEFGAVRLFGERAQAANVDFAVTDENAGRWRPSAAAWTDCRWRSSWRRPGAGSSRRRRCCRGWRGGCRC